MTEQQKSEIAWLIDLISEKEAALRHIEHRVSSDIILRRNLIAIVDQAKRLRFLLEENAHAVTYRISEI